MKTAREIEDELEESTRNMVLLVQASKRQAALASQDEVIPVPPSPGSPVPAPPLSGQRQR